MRMCSGSNMHVYKVSVEQGWGQVPILGSKLQSTPTPRQALTKANRDLATERQHALIQANEMDKCTSPTHRLAKETRVTVRMNHALPSAWTISAEGENNPQQATDREAAASCGRSDTDSRSQGHEMHIANQLQELKALVQQMEGTEKALCQATRSCIQGQ